MDCALSGSVGMRGVGGRGGKVCRRFWGCRRCVLGEKGRFRGRSDEEEKGKREDF